MDRLPSQILMVALQPDQVDWIGEVDDWLGQKRNSHAL